MTDQHTVPHGKFDMGRAYQALDIDYNIYPRQDRRTMLLTHLEACIEPAPETPTVPDRATTVLPLLMAGWLLFAGLLTLILAPQLWWLELPTIALGGYVLYRHLTTQHHRKEPR